MRLCHFVAAEARFTYFLVHFVLKTGDILMRFRLVYTKVLQNANIFLENAGHFPRKRIDSKKLSKVETNENRDLSF